MPDDKRYSAKNVLELDHIAKGLKAYMILLDKFGGTGAYPNSATSFPKDVNISSDITTRLHLIQQDTGIDMKDQRICPRYKEEFFELMFGLGTIIDDEEGVILPNTVCLDELSIKHGFSGNSIYRFANLGQFDDSNLSFNIINFFKDIYRQEGISALNNNQNLQEPFITTTYWNSPFGTNQRHGSLHAIVNFTNKPQVAMFLEFDREQASQFFQGRVELENLIRFPKILH